jgi:hypothetical protein
MVGIPAPTIGGFAYEKQRHHPSRSRRWRSGHGRSRCRHRRRRRGTELHDEYDDPIHKQRGDHAVEHHHDTVNDDTEDADSAAGIQRSSVPEHGRQVRLGLKLGFWLELRFGLRRRPSGRRHHPVVTSPVGPSVSVSAKRTEPPGRGSTVREDFLDQRLRRRAYLPRPARGRPSAASRCPGSA